MMVVVRQMVVGMVVGVVVGRMVGAVVVVRRVRVAHHHGGRRQGTCAQIVRNHLAQVVLYLGGFCFPSGPLGPLDAPFTEL